MKHSEALATLDRVNLWLDRKGGPVVPLFTNDHLDLPEGFYSTYIEGWYVGDLYGMQAVSEAILNGEILLPPNVSHEMFSHCEMYFFTS